MSAALNPVLNLWREAYFGWARRQVNPQHPDVLAIELAYLDAVNGVALSPTASRIKCTARVLALPLQRALRAFWRWC